MLTSWTEYWQHDMWVALVGSSSHATADAAASDEIVVHPGLKPHTSETLVQAGMEQS